MDDGEGGLAAAGEMLVEAMLVEHGDGDGGGDSDDGDRAAR